MTVEVRIPWASDDALSEALRRLTKALHIKGLADGEQGGFFGGEWGYGADFENDVFLMHRFCSCEREDCLWCAGSRCQSENPHHPHRAGCYQRRIEGFDQGEYGSKQRQRYDAFKRALCEAMGLDFDFGNEVHCTCGIDAEWRARYDACECDWHMGRGEFRFGRAVSAPHFWHKATGITVRWYKYIGRGMEVHVPEGVDERLGPVYESCLASIGVTDADIDAVHDGPTVANQMQRIIDATNAVMAGPVTRDPYLGRTEIWAP